MPNINTLKCAGLHTSANELGSVPEGALVQADNCVIRSKDVLEPRPGQQAYKTSGVDAISSVFYYNETLFAHSGTTLYYNSGASSLTAKSGSYSVPSSTARVRGVEAQRNLYFTTATGVHRLDSTGGTPAPAGGVKALDMQGSMNYTTGSFLADDHKVAYRYTVCFKDANGVVYQGPPSPRGFCLNNSGSAKGVQVIFTTPSDVVVGTHFYRVYRTESLDVSGDATDPGDEMCLVKEAYFTSTHTANRFVMFTDDTPDSQRGVPLYTNPNSGDGILQANDPPPRAEDIAWWNNRLWYANVNQPHRYYLDLLGVSSLATGHTITLTGPQSVTLTASSVSADASTGTWLIYTASGDSAVNIEETARSIVEVINQYATNTTYNAYYLSGPNDTPGKIMIETRSVSASQFTVAISAAAQSSFNPDLSVSGNSTSDNDDVVNRVYYSKLQQPDAVPLVNYLDVGSRNKAILRILPLRDRLLVFKEDEGIYIISGEAPFRCDLLDDTVSLIAPETAATVNNQVFFLSAQGVCAATEAGVAIVSRPIESELFSTGLTTYRSASRTLPFGVGWEKAHQYQLWIPSDSASSPTYCDQAYVYNAILGVWTKWVMNRRCGVVDKASGYLVMGGPTSGVYRGSDGTYEAEYYDEQTSGTVSSASGTTLTFNADHGLAVGDLVRHNASGYRALVTSVPTSTTATVNAWSGATGACNLYQSYQVTAKWAAEDGGDPGSLKLFREAKLHFLKRQVYQPSATFQTELSQSSATVPLVFSDASVGTPTGSTSNKVGTVDMLEQRRVLVPQDKARAVYLRVGLSMKEACSYFKLGGVTLTVEASSDRTHK